MMSFFFFGLNFCTNVKNKYEMGIFYLYFFYKRKSLDLPKVKIMLQHFPFGLVTKFFNVYIGSYNMSSFNVKSFLGSS
jgi:hypothetical protein